METEIETTSEADKTDIEEGKDSTHLPDNPPSASIKEEEKAAEPASLEPVIERENETQAAEDDERKWVKGLPLFTLMAAITVVTFLMLLDTSIIATAIPRITSDFHSLPDVGWYGSAYLLASATLQPLTGKIFANFHIKWTYITFFGIFELGSLLCGVAQSSKMLIVGRAVAGMGGSGIINGGLTMLANAVPMHRRPALTGIMMGCSQLGIVAGPLVGGAFTSYTSWRWCFYINLPVGGLVAFALLFLHIPSHPSKVKSLSDIPAVLEDLDLIGFALFAPAAVQFLLALQWGGNQYAWDSATVIGLFCGALGTIIVFVIWEYFKGESAMIPLSMLRIRIVWCGCLYFAMLVGMVLCGSYYIPIYFQAVKGVSPITSGVWILPSIISQLLAAVSSGFLMGKVGYYLPFAVASSVVGAAGNGLFTTFSPSTSTGEWIGYQIIAGFGRGLGMQVPIIAIQSSLTLAQTPVGMAFLMFSQSLSGSVFLSFADTVFTNKLRAWINTFAPTVNPQTVINPGATAIREVVSPQDLDGVLLAYSKSLDDVFYLATAATIAGFAFAFGLGWRDVRKKQNQGQQDAQVDHKSAGGEVKGEEVDIEKGSHSLGLQGTTAGASAVPAAGDADLVTGAVKGEAEAEAQHQKENEGRKNDDP